MDVHPRKPAYVDLDAQQRKHLARELFGRVCQDSRHVRRDDRGRGVVTREREAMPRARHVLVVA